MLSQWPSRPSLFSSDLILVTPARRDRMQPRALTHAGVVGDAGWSRVARAAVAPAVLHSASATAAGTLPMQTVPPPLPEPVAANG